MKCLSCDTELDGHAETGGSDLTPEEGDLSMCIYCGALAYYTMTDGVLGLRHPTGEEHRELIRNSEVQQMLRKRKELMADW